MGSLRSFSPDSSDDERTTIHSVHSPSVASSLSVGPVSGISSIVRNGETRQLRSGGQKVSAPARNEARFTAGMSSDRAGLLMGFRAVEERFEQLIDGRGLRVTAEEIVELQSATDTYTQLLNLKREQLRGDGALRSQTFGALGRGENVVESSKSRSIDEGIHSIGGSSKVIEAARTGSHNGRSFMGDGYHRHRAGAALSPTLEDRRDWRNSAASMSGTQPYRPDSPSSTVGSKTVQFTERQHENLRALGDAVRLEMSRHHGQPEEEEQQRRPTQLRPPPDDRRPTDLSFDVPVRVDTRSFPRRQFTLNAEISPIGNAVDNWLQAPQPPHLSTAFRGSQLSPPTRQVPVQMTTDCEPPTTSDQAVEVHLDRSDDLRLRLIGFRYRLNEIGQQQQSRMRQDQSTSPIRLAQEENKRPRLPISAPRANALKGHADDAKLKPPPFISAKFVGTSHSVHTNMQQLLASLKQQHPTLHQLGLRLGGRATVPQLAQAFRDELTRMLRRAESLLEQRLNEYDRLNEQMNEATEAAEQERFTVQLGQLSVAIERQDSAIQRLQNQLLRLEKALGAAAASLKPMSRTCGQRLHTVPIGRSHITDHTFSSMQKSTSCPATLTSLADGHQHGSQVTAASNGGRQLRELRVLQCAFAP